MILRGESHCGGEKSMFFIAFFESNNHNQRPQKRVDIYHIRKLNKEYKYDK